MNRRISNDMAVRASRAMAKALYGERIESSFKVLQSACENYVIKYIPMPVLQVTKEYERYFELFNDMTFSCFNSGDSPLFCTISFSVPRFARHIKLGKNDFQALRILFKKYRKLRAESQSFESRIYDALKTLKDEKNVVESLPEAVKFIEFPEVKQLPSPIFNDLRVLLQSIT